MIRAVTLGVPVAAISITEIDETIRRFQSASQELISERQWPARTARISLPPLREEHEEQAFALPSFLASISRIADAHGIRWFCLPIDLLSGAQTKQRLSMALESLLRERKLFLNLMVADEQTIGIEAATDAAKFILNASRKSNNGFDNFRVGASCNCPSNAPFFPFSRHEGNDFRFSLALETTSLALEASELVKNGEIGVAEFSELFVDALNRRLKEIDEFARELEERSGVTYVGLDASLAPFPDGATSVGRLLENLGASPAGSHGTLFLTSVLTDAIRSALRKSGVLSTGFNGVMYSVLEDDYLAKANNRRNISINSLQAYSTLCGCGLDMIPIPGTAFCEDIAAIILDTASLAVRLKKPLGVRLLPIPNKVVNEFTEFNLDFLCDSRVMSISAGDTKLNPGERLWRYPGSGTV
jgi:hypothetical protein